MKRRDWRRVFFFSLRNRQKVASPPPPCAPTPWGAGDPRAPASPRKGPAPSLEALRLPSRKIPPPPLPDGPHQNQKQTPTKARHPPRPTRTRLSTRCCPQKPIYSHNPRKHLPQGFPPRPPSAKTQMSNLHPPPPLPPDPTPTPEEGAARTFLSCALPSLKRCGRR